MSSTNTGQANNFDVPSMSAGPWGLSKTTQGFSNTLPNSIKYTRKGYAQGLLSFDSACERIKARRYTGSYVFYEVTKEDGSTVIVKSKAAVRGNDVYRARVWNRHKELLSFCEINDKISYIIPHPSGGHTCNILKCTLNVRPPWARDGKGGWDRDEFNSWYLNYFYDLFVKRIRNAFPGVVVAKSLEVSTKELLGWIHINAILVFPNHSFPVYQHTSRLNTHRNGDPIKSWRLKYYYSHAAIKAGDYANISKEFFEYSWDCGHVDVRAVTGPHDLAEYTLKYHIKEFTDKVSHDTQELTFSTLSLYDKRCFSFPRASEIRGTKDFTETVIDYTTELDNDGPVNFPRLDIILHNPLDIKFLGHFLDVNDNFNGNLWFEVVEHPPSEIDKGFFGNYSLGLPVDTISTWDSGSRQVNGLWVQSATNPSVEHHRLLGDSKKYSHLKEMVDTHSDRETKDTKSANVPGNLVIVSCSISNAYIDEHYRKDYSWL